MGRRLCTTQFLTRKDVALVEIRCYALTPDVLEQHAQDLQNGAEVLT